MKGLLVFVAILVGIFAFFGGDTQSPTKIKQTSYEKIGDIERRTQTFIGNAKKQVTADYAKLSIKISMSGKDIASLVSNFNATVGDIVSYIKESAVLPEEITLYDENISSEFVDEKMQVVKQYNISRELVIALNNVKTVERLHNTFEKYQSKSFKIITQKPIYEYRNVKSAQLQLEEQALKDAESKAYKAAELEGASILSWTDMNKGDFKLSSATDKEEIYSIEKNITSTVKVRYILEKE